MEYSELYNYLNTSLNYNNEIITLENNIELHNIDFTSDNSFILPCSKNSFCKEHNFYPPKPDDFPIYDNDEMKILRLDSEIEENNNFKIQLIKPKGQSPVKDIIIMFNGLNEKDWSKYYPWAYKLAQDTGKAIALFPLAFHINRAPAQWSDRRFMSGLSKNRKSEFPETLCSTIINVAISTRLTNNPLRFIWSGLQSYYDVMQFIQNIKSSTYSFISESANIDLFAYSVSGLLTMTLMMTNQNSYFENSKMGLFCSGAVFNRMSPVSRFIMDSSADLMLYKHLVEYLDSNIKNDLWLNHYFSNLHLEGKNFLSLLNFSKYTSYREPILNKMCNNIFAIPLKNDNVVPYYEVMSALQGAGREIPIKVDVMDFDFKYTHEMPFPPNETNTSELDKSFNEVFDKFSAFYSK
jgi:hypothetical protein